MALQRYETVSAALWRVVSPKAREAYKTAQERMQEATRSVDRWGIKTDAEWQRRQADHEKQEKKRPELERKAQGLTATRGILSHALKGFEKQAERQKQTREREEQAKIEERSRQWEERARAQERRTRDGYDRGR